jgi:hypothetical protein
MNRSITGLRAWHAWKESTLLAIVTAYEDAFTVTRGVEFCHNLARELGPGCQITQQAWFFNELRVAKLREIAAGEAAVADLVIISAHRAESLPEEVRCWVDSWVGWQGKRPAALVVLVDAASGGAASAVETHLEQVARNGHLEYLVEVEEVPVHR